MSALKEPEDSPGRSEGELNASSTADVAMLDVLYGDLPSYQPTSAERREAEGTAVPEATKEQPVKILQ